MFCSPDAHPATNSSRASSCSCAIETASPLPSTPFVLRCYLMLVMRLQGHCFDQSQLAALCNQQQLSQQLQLGGLPEHEHPPFSLHDSTMMPAWQTQDPGHRHWMP